MFHNMDYVYCVYKEKSFSKAAERLHISQPSLSAAVKKVEDEAGTPIFERKTRPVSLTPFGVEFIQGIEQIYEIEEHLHNVVYEMHTLQRGFISIGCSNLNVPFVITEKLAEFKKMYPNVELRIIECSTDQSKRLLDNGELNFIITNCPLPQEEYEQKICYKENLILAIPKEYPINEKLKAQRLSGEECGDMIFQIPRERSVSFGELQSVPFVLLSDGNYLRRCCDRIFEENNVTPRIVLEVDKSSISYNFANFGIGATIISNVLVRDLVDGSNLYFYKLDSPHVDRDAFICYKRGRYVSTAMKTLIEFLMLQEEIEKKEMKGIF